MWKKLCRGSKSEALSKLVSGRVEVLIVAKLKLMVVPKKKGVLKLKM